MTVINLHREAEPLVVQCFCGSQTFYVYEDAEIKCSECGGPAKVNDMVVIGEWVEDD